MPGKSPARPLHYGHRQRLKDRFLASPEALPDYELLELLLGYGLPQKDTKPLAKSLLAKFSGLRGVLLADTLLLTKETGVGKGLALYLLALRELWTRTRAEELPRRAVLSDPGAVHLLARDRLGTSPKESFWVALVDNKNRLLEFCKVGDGTVDQAAVFPREVAAQALFRHASGAVLVHNHPGGDPSPSRQDREVTRRIGQALQSLNIRLLDHVIVAEEQWFSFQAEGLLE